LFFQVVGLHFLHPLIIWLELGSMLVLTLIRAYVRRGLAPHPPHCRAIDTQELASLCLALALPESFDAGKPLAPVKLIKSLKPWRPTIHSQWELITGRLPLLESGAGPLESPVQWIEQWEQKGLLLSSIKRSAKRSSEAYHHDQEVRDASEVPEIEFFTSAVSQDRTLLPAEVARVGNRLARAIEGVIMYMRCAGGDDVRWKHPPLFAPSFSNKSGPPSPADKTLMWEIPIIRQGPDSGNNTSVANAIRIALDLGSLERSRSHGNHMQSSPFNLHAVLSFWLHTLAFKYGKTPTHCTRRDFYDPQDFSPRGGHSAS
jgi:hypothetical protein